MFTLIFKSNLRLIGRNKFISTVKILGLASGTAIVFLTAHFCLSELRYDKQHPNYDRIFRYVHRVSTPEGTQSFAFTSATTGPALKERYPEVEAYSRIFKPANVSVQNVGSDVSFNERRFAFADSNFFELFNSR
jgi:putative ABC transport system permease protein